MPSVVSVLIFLVVVLEVCVSVTILLVVVLKVCGKCGNIYGDNFGPVW